MVVRILGTLLLHYNCRFSDFADLNNSNAQIIKGTPAKIPIGAGPSRLIEPVLVRHTAKGIVPTAFNAP